MNEIYILTDYKGYFGSKQKTTPYKSGFDKNALQKYFTERKFNPIFLNFADVDFKKVDLRNKYVIYTSAEDQGLHYKDYIEDIILGLYLQGAKLIPHFKFLRANNNKVFMEILRDQSEMQEIKNIKSTYLSTLEDLKRKENFPDKNVLKLSAGAMSSGVFLTKSKDELIKKCKINCRTRYIYKELWDIKNTIKHRYFIPDSLYRKKFIVQNYIENLQNDWKLLVYGESIYILKRMVRKNDFRASGSGIFEFTKEIPKGILEFAYQIKENFNVPNISLDIAYADHEFYLIEFQAIYFGTKTLENAPFYFKNSIVDFIEKVKI